MSPEQRDRTLMRMIDKRLSELGGCIFEQHYPLRNAQEQRTEDEAAELARLRILR